MKAAPTFEKDLVDTIIPKGRDNTEFNRALGNPLHTLHRNKQRLLIPLLIGAPFKTNVPRGTLLTFGQSVPIYTYKNRVNPK